MVLSRRKIHNGVGSVHGEAWIGRWRKAATAHLHRRNDPFVDFPADLRFHADRHKIAWMVVVTPRRCRVSTIFREEARERDEHFVDGNPPRCKERLRLARPERVLG